MDIKTGAYIILFQCITLGLAGFTTTTSPSKDIYGDNVCTRTVVEPTVNVSTIRFGCWKPKRVSCNSCYGSRCQKFPLNRHPSTNDDYPFWSHYPQWSRSSGNWKPTSGMEHESSWDHGWWSSESSRIPWSSLPGMGSDSSWWNPTALPSWYHGWSSSWSSDSSWSQGWWSSDSSWSQGWWSSDSSWSNGEWSSGSSWWNPTTTVSSENDNTDYMCFMKQFDECFTTHAMRSYHWVDEKYCCNGYEQFGDQCIETEHCMGNNGGCEQKCQDGYDWPECSCWDGYEFDGYLGCTDIDECSTGEHNCEHKCINTLGSYYCECNPGYIHTPSGECKAINKCSYANGGCEHKCVNTSPGEHHCACYHGYTLVGDYMCERGEGFVNGIGHSVSEDDGDDGLSKGTLAGIIIGCICVVVLIIILAFVAIKLIRRPSSQSTFLVHSTPGFTNPEYVTATGESNKGALVNVYEQPIAANGKLVPPPTYDALHTAGNVYDNPVIQEKPVKGLVVEIPEEKPLDTES